MNIQNQAEIVKQRLTYHFLQIDGSWDVPKNLPFMKEFLNEIKTLCKLIESELHPKQS